MLPEILLAEAVDGAPKAWHATPDKGPCSAAVEGRGCLEQPAAFAHAQSACAAFSRQGATAHQQFLSGIAL